MNADYTDLRGSKRCVLLSLALGKTRAHGLSASEGLAADERPAFDGTPVAGLPVSVFDFQDEAGVDDEVECGFILKADVDGVVVARGIDLGGLDDFALKLLHPMHAARRIAADGGLAALDDFGRRQARDGPSLSGFDFGFG